jgi:hypothetical protein
MGRDRPISLLGLGLGLVSRSGWQIGLHGLDAWAQIKNQARGAAKGGDRSPRRQTGWSLILGCCGR